MKVAVIGSGGREHALVRALSQSDRVSQIQVFPGSSGISLEPKVLCFEEALSLDQVEAVWTKQPVDLVVIGPEQPLADGWSDALRKKGLPVVGPSQGAAQLEASKVYSKEFMLEFQVPTARSIRVSSFEEVRRHYSSFAPPWVLKADGLAGGKGVTLHNSEEDLFARARELFDLNRLGTAGATALLEEFQPGWEMSYLILTNGDGFVPLPVSQDHKRLLDGDQGPNTGGMGTIAPLALDPELERRIQTEIVAPTLRGLHERQLLYRGVLYIGLMITPQGPRVIEYNVRFGDPEAQVLMPLLDGDWLEVFEELAQGNLRKLQWKPESAACVVLAAPGYPDCPEKGVPIETLPEASSPSAYLLHAGTRRTAKGWETQGGRVLNVIGLGKTRPEALANAYKLADQVRWRGLQMRRDIGKTTAG